MLDHGQGCGGPAAEHGSRQGVAAPWPQHSNESPWGSSLSTPGTSWRIWSVMPFTEGKAQGAAALRHRRWLRGDTSCPRPDLQRSVAHRPGK